MLRRHLGREKPGVNHALAAPTATRDLDPAGAEIDRVETAVRDLLAALGVDVTKTGPSRRPRR